MEILDKQYTQHPSWGVKRMTAWLRLRGEQVNPKRVRRLLRKMGLEAVYQKPKLSKKHPEHKIYPYLLRNLDITRPNQVWCSDITYIRMNRGFVYLTVHCGLVQSKGVVLGTVDDAGFIFLRQRPGRGHCHPWETGNLQHRAGGAVHGPRIHEGPQEPWHQNQHGRTRQGVGQYLRREALADRQIRGSVPEGIPDSSGSKNQPGGVLLALQQRTAAPEPGRQNALRGLRLSKSGSTSQYLKNRRTDHLIFVTPWSKEWGVPHFSSSLSSGWPMKTFAID